MPECSHCHQYYFGNPEQCPNCYYEFKTGRIRTPEALAKERQRKQEERDRQIQEEAAKEKELAEQRSLTIKNNAQYEYATEFLFDSRNGRLDKDELDHVLKKYSSQGWRLHTVFSNEAGKNVSAVAVGGVSMGSNSTIDVTVLIFERCIKPSSF